MTLNTQGETPPKAELISPEALYRAYPRHVERKDALKAIARALKKVPAEQLMAAVKRYAEACDRAGKDRQFIPHPATWFNGERWADEELPEPPTNGHGRPSVELAKVEAELWSMRNPSMRELQDDAWTKRKTTLEGRRAELAGEVRR